jgi:hypothetical protein
MDAKVICVVLLALVWSGGTQFNTAPIREREQTAEIDRNSEDNLMSLPILPPKAKDTLEKSQFSEPVPVDKLADESSNASADSKSISQMEKDLKGLDVL